MSQQGARQASFRAIGGSAGPLNGDKLAAFAAEATIPAGTPINGAFILWLQERLGSSVNSLPSLQTEFAVAEGADNWPSLGSFDPAEAVPELILIDRTAGTNIGSMSSNGGLAAAFDGVTTQAAAACAGANSSAGYVGKTLAAGMVIGRITAHGSSDAGYVSGSNPSVTLDMYGKAGAAPASGTDGTIIGSITFTDTADERVGRDIDSTDLETEWDHTWVRVDPGGSVQFRVAELVMYQWAVPA